ncbi:MAG: hypothetical protein ABIO83_08635 [Ilumatobacteraceae bacterium]
MTLRAQCIMGHSSAVCPHDMLPWRHLHCAGDYSSITEVTELGTRVSAWNDVIDGAHATQGTHLDRPVYRASDPDWNNQASIYFGNSRSLIEAAVTATASVFTLIVLLKQDSGLSVNRFSDDSVTGGGRIIVGRFNTRWQLYLGSGGANTVTADFVPNMHRIVQNGTSDKLFINETLIYTASAGTSQYVGQTLGSPTNPNSCVLWGVIETADVTADPGWSTFKQWVRDTYALTIA